MFATKQCPGEPGDVAHRASPQPGKPPRQEPPCRADGRLRISGPSESSGEVVTLQNLTELLQLHSIMLVPSRARSEAVTLGQRLDAFLKNRRGKRHQPARLIKEGFTTFVRETKVPVTKADDADPDSVRRQPGDPPAKLAGFFLEGGRRCAGSAEHRAGGADDLSKSIVPAGDGVLNSHPIDRQPTAAPAVVLAIGEGDRHVVNLPDETREPDRPRSHSLRVRHFRGRQRSR